MEGFRVPHSESAEVFAARARSFAEHARPLEEKFLELGFDEAIIEDLLQRVEDYSNADDEGKRSTRARPAPAAARAARFEKA